MTSSPRLVILLSVVLASLMWSGPAASAAPSASRSQAQEARAVTASETSETDAAKSGKVTWRERYAKKFVVKVKKRDWSWVRKQGDRQLVKTAKNMGGIKRLRVLGTCYHSAPKGAFCDLSNYYGLTFNRADGPIRIDGLFLQD